MKILFTGGGGAGNEAIWRLLGERYELHFADASLDAICPSIPSGRRHRIPMATATDFVDGLADLCARESIDLLVPAVDEELPKMPPVASKVPAMRVLVPQEEVVETCLDKLQMVRRLAGAGLDMPRTATIENVGEVGFPCIVKPRRGRGSRGVSVVRTRAELDAYLVLAGKSPDDFLVQELLVGQEYTVLMAADARANLRAVVPVEVALKRGITLRARTVEDESVDSACRAIQAAMPARGCYNIQLIKTKDGCVAPFEINPRVSTTFCLGLAAGVDPIAIFSETETADKSFIPGVELRRYWTNHFSRG